MAVLKNCVVILIVALTVSDVARARYFSQYLHNQQQLQEQQEQEEQEQEQQDQEKETGTGGVLRDRLEKLRRERQQAELQEDLFEEMEEIIEDYGLEDLAAQMATDALGRILRPLREHPTESPIDDCVTRTFPVAFEFGLSGTIVYRVCGSGDDASLRMRFQLPGQTTPAVVDTTTPMETTTVIPGPLCPKVPATTTPEDDPTTTTPKDDPTTTTTTPDDDPTITTTPDGDPTTGGSARDITTKAAVTAAT